MFPAAFGLRQDRQQLEVLAQLSLGKEQRLAVVRAGTRYFILGVTTGSISVLSEMTAEEAACWENPPAPPEGGQPPGFREALGELLKQKGRR